MRAKARAIRLSCAVAFLVAVITLSGCATPVPDDPAFAVIDSVNLPQPNISIRIPGLGPCTSKKDRSVEINVRESDNILVHGCYGSAARFRALVEVFAFHGQQTLCFSYDDRDSMMKSSNELISALEQLKSILRNRELTIIAHSQGGLIERKALVQDRPSPWAAGDTKVRLTTVSAPFSGIASASRCVSKSNLIWSLGLAFADLPTD